MKLGVVIVTYNRLELLSQCIEHAVGQTYPFSKIVVVNNASIDGTYEYLGSLQDPKIYPIHLNENLGGSGGFSKGLEYCVELDLDWVLLIDDDAIVDYDFNRKIIEGMYSHKDVRAFSGTVLANGVIAFGNRRMQIGKTIMQYPVDRKEYLEKEFIYDISTFCGLYISTKLVRTIGLPEKDYFIYYDDTEYSLRIRKHTAIINVNEAIINHMVKTGHSNGNDLWRRYYGVRNELLMCRKHFPKWQQVFCDIKNFARIMWHIIKYTYKDKEYEKRVIYTIISASRDGHNDRIGKNQKFLPTKANNEAEHEI